MEVIEPQIADLTHVIELVEGLSRPQGDPNQIRRYQQELQKVQRSSQGWVIANKLLEQDSPNCQFYGALTFNVKLINMSREEPDVDVRQACAQLLTWLLVRKSHKRFVAMKIVSTLSTLFIKYPSVWPSCIASVCATLAYGKPILHLNNDEVHQLAGAVASLSEPDLFVASQFCQTLVEDMSKESQIETKAMAATDKLLESSSVFASLMTACLGRTGELSIIAIECIGQWVSFFTPNKVRGTDIAHFDGTLLNFLNSPDDHLYSRVIQTVSDLYVYHPSFFTTESKAQIERFLLDNAGSIEHISEEILEGRLGPYIRLSLVYCEKHLSSFLQEGHNPKYTAMLDMILRVSRSDIAIADDPIVTELLEFWSNFVEEIVSGGFLSDRNTVSNGYVSHVIDTFWMRIRLPAMEKFAQLSRDELEKFNSLRAEFCDFLETSYPIVGTVLFTLLTTSVTSNLQASVLHDGSRDYSRINWAEVEASLYCLTGLSDIVGESGREYATVKKVFSSSLWQDLSVCQHTRIRQTAVNLIGSYDSFFEREDGQQYLAPSLSYLFESLSSDSLSLTASRSIQKLCMSSRRHLTGMINSFFDAYESLNLYSTLETVSHERTVLALSYVIQALESLSEKADYVARLLGTLFSQIDLAVHALASASSDSIKDDVSRIVSLLRCIVNVGKGLQVPEDVQVPSQERDAIKSFWDSDPHGTRRRLLLVIKEFTVDNKTLMQVPTFSESCCNIFRSGFSEVVHNPFVFDIETVVDFIVVKYGVGPLSCYPYLIELATCLITAHSVEQSSIIYPFVTRLLRVFFSTHVTPEYEPDVSTECLKFLSQILKKHALVILHDEHCHQLAGFVVAMVNSNERFVLRAAITFWADLISLEIPDDGLRSLRSNLVISSGQELVEIIVRKVSGDGTRSDLQSYTDLLKKVVANYPVETRQWLTKSVINAPHRALYRTDERMRTQFVTKVLNLRGRRETNKVVKDFWLAARGIGEDYISAPVGV